MGRTPRLPSTTPSPWAIAAAAARSIRRRPVRRPSVCSTRSSARMTTENSRRPNGASIDQQLEVIRSRYQQVTPAEADALCRRGALLVDTRCSNLRIRCGVVPDAIHVPLSVLPWRADASSEHADRRLGGRRLLILCQDGYSSTLAVGILLDLGIPDVTDVRGGYMAWRDAGLPIRDAR